MPRRHITRLGSAIALGCLLATSRMAGAQGTGRSMDFDPSVSSTAMGGASTAVFWNDIDHWGNPALLGYARGVRYVHTHSQLIPELASNVILASDVVQFGGGGLGVVMSGRPGDVGGVSLDYGASEGRDESGNFTGNFDSFEHVKSKGVGISVMRAVETAFALTGHDPPALSRYADVSAGMNWKDLTMQLAPTSLGGRGETSARDWGVQARVTPINGLDAGSGPPLRIDLSYGVSVLSYNDDAVVTFINEDQASPVTRHHRHGVAGRIAAGRMPAHGPAGLGHLLLSGMTPIASGALAVDHAELGGGSSIDYETDGSGFEIGVANVLFYRHGHYEDLEGQIDGKTWGYGVSLPLGPRAGLRYDAAWWPQGGGLKHRRSYQLSAWFDPVALLRSLGPQD